ncbi:MAG: DUF2207 domain-containing protein [Thermomicrobiales bacterium]
MLQTAPVNTATPRLHPAPRGGSQGDESRQQRDVTGGKNGQAWFWRAEHLSAGDTLQASLRFPSRLRPATRPGRLRLIANSPGKHRPTWQLLGLALLTAVGGSVGLLAAWWTRGRDPLPGPTPERRTEPPDDTPPGIVGALLDEQVDERDYLATLIDLARRDIVHISGVAQPVASRNQPGWS